MDDELAHLWCPDCGQSLCGLKQDDWEPCEPGAGMDDTSRLECIVCHDLYRPTRKYRCCKRSVA